MESAAPTDCFSADLDAHRQVIGTERHLQAQAFSTRNISRCSARADQFQDGVRCIYQWWRRRHHYHPKHYRFAGELLGRFFYQIILADPVEQRLATTNIIELRSFCGHQCVSMLRCAVLSLCAGTAFRIIHKPRLRSALGIGAGPILIAGRVGKLNASFSKKACRSGYDILLILVCICVLGSRWRRKLVSLTTQGVSTPPRLPGLVGLPHTLSYRFGPVLFQKP
jgi:hypothetical protein